MEIQFEKGRDQDINEIGRLYDDLCDYLAYNVNYPGWAKGVYPNRDTAVSGVEQGTLFVAKCGNKIVGTVILNRIPETGYEGANWSFKTDYSDVLVVHTLAVHPDYLKYGIGKFIIRSCIDYAREKDIKALRLDVYERNGPAIKLYEAFGFQYIDTVDLGLGRYGLDWFRLYEKVLID